MKRTRLKKSLIMLIMVLFIVSVLFTGCGKTGSSTGDSDLNMRYVSFGSGEKTMVVVPGLTIGYVTDNKEALETSFADFTDDYTVYLFDIRDDVPADYTMDQMGEDLVTTIKKLGLKDIYMYGCSMGGMQCIYTAGTYPDLVKKVVVASSAVKANDTSEAVIGNWISLAKDGNYHGLTDDMGQKIYSQAVYEAKKEAFSSMADGLTEDVAARFANTAGALVNLDLIEEAESVECPVLVLGAEGDQVLTSAASEEIAEITGGQIYLYGPEYPHAVYDEVPDFKKQVKAFFDEETNSTVNQTDKAA